MIKSRETEVLAIVAVGPHGVLAPCGRCRELLLLVDVRNGDAQVGLPGGRTARLHELLPGHWLREGIPATHAKK